MSAIKLWRTFTNVIVEKTLTIGVGGRIIVKNPDESVLEATFDEIETGMTLSAAFGVLTPVLAGAAMAFSSVSVVANALLLKRWRAGR